jgi:hypothetical protein
MKLQRKILLILIIIFSVSFLSDSIQAQGIYSKNKDSQTKSSSSSAPKLRGGADPDDKDFGNGDQVDEPGGSTDTPIGEGWLILTVLSGGYALLQKRKTKKTV